MSDRSAGSPTAPYRYDVIGVTAAGEEITLGEIRPASSMTRRQAENDAQGLANTFVRDDRFRAVVIRDVTPPVGGSGQVFDAQAVVNLWRHQFGPHQTDPFAPDYFPAHPFTCPNRGDHPHMAGDKGVLVPTVRGWICPFCNYTQNWAHEPMKAGFPRAEGC